MVSLEDVSNFVSGAKQMYRKCFLLLGFDEHDYDPRFLVSAARRNETPRRGTLIDPENNLAIQYHIHGNGYTLRDTENGSEYRFSARVINEVGRLTFTSWDLLQFCGGAGVEDIESELRQFASSNEELAHFEQGITSYFTLTDEEGS